MQQRDRQQIHEHGLTRDEVERQLRIFADPPPATVLDRACVPGDGIWCLDAPEIERALAAWKRAARKGRFTKFVPASGAASRMFKALESIRRKGHDRAGVEEAAAAGDRDASAAIEFFDGLTRFAFHPRLTETMRGAGEDLEQALREGRWSQVLTFVLEPQGLGLAQLAKGLIEFHTSIDGVRTAFEEHLAEAMAYASDGNGICRLHLTVSPPHLEPFRALLSRVAPLLEAERGVKFEVVFSTQKSATDTIAVEQDNTPFRDPEGALLFRPGGHGSLIENLNDVGGDVVYVKNVDNVLPEARATASNHWKRILGGVLVLLQSRIHRHLEALEVEPANEAVVDAALVFAESELGLPFPEAVRSGAFGEKRALLIEALDRPVRVCGMVRNEGEPGGGPFWVRDRGETSTRQIVESAQVDLGDGDQEAILRSSTHFNPVDLVCGVRDWRGQPFDLPSYVDPSTVFLAEKSSGGRVLKALERPGLWNGAMANWVTVFVEVPAETFHPVKTVGDLLRIEHQPVPVERAA